MMRLGRAALQGPPGGLAGGVWPAVVRARDFG